MRLAPLVFILLLGLVAIGGVVVIRGTLSLPVPSTVSLSLATIVSRIEGTATPTVQSMQSPSTLPPSRSPSSPSIPPSPSPRPLPSPTLRPSFTPTPLPVGSGYWHTDGTQIVDSQGHVIRIAATTWYGMESSYWVPAGLDFQPYTAILDTVKGLGFNAIRLPFSNELVESNPIVVDKVTANPQFRGMHALQVMDALVRYAGQIGLKIILDDHRCAAARPKHVNYLDEPLWYTRDYPETSWIKDWETLARRYAGQDALIGFDLRNEPHTDGPGPWTLSAYLNQGAVWGPHQGIVDTARDWRLAAQQVGNAILAINPHLLMFVEGVQLYPSAKAPNGIDSYWWGSILTPVRDYPVIFNVPHQLVYSPHDWGPWKWNMSWFKNMTYESIQRVWHQRWSFISEDPTASYAAPIWIGEMGTCTHRPDCIDLQKQGNQAQWFHLLLRYLQEHPTIGWSFFALNGTNSNDHAANNGLLNHQWNGVANDSLLAALKTIEH